MFSTNADRLSILENEARLADLEIERTPLKDLSKLDIQNMTAGEIITLANVVEAVRILSAELTPGGYGPLQEYAKPSTSERRSRSSDDQPTEAEEEAIAKLRTLLTERLSDDNAMVNTVNGPVRYADVPRGPDGDVDLDWLDANCTCDDHERRRIDADKPKADPSIAAGLYL